MGVFVFPPFLLLLLLFFVVMSTTGPRSLRLLLLVLRCGVTPRSRGASVLGRTLTGTIRCLAALLPVLFKDRRLVSKHPSFLFSSSWRYRVKLLDATRATRRGLWSVFSLLRLLFIISFLKLFQSILFSSASSSRSPAAAPSTICECSDAFFTDFVVVSVGGCAILRCVSGFCCVFRGTSDKGSPRGIDSSRARPLELEIESRRAPVPRLTLGLRLTLRD